MLRTSRKGLGSENRGKAKLAVKDFSEGTENHLAKNQLAEAVGGG